MFAGTGGARKHEALLRSAGWRGLAMPPSAKPGMADIDAAAVWCFCDNGLAVLALGSFALEKKA